MGALGALGAARIIAAMRLVIIERDGVLCVEREGYLRSPDDWQAQPGALEAIAQLNHAGYQVAVSAIWPGLGQGQFDMATVNAIQARMSKQLAAVGGRVDAVFFCPHAPDEACDCRKPQPGLLRQIGERYKTNLAQVHAVGASARDVQAAHAAGCIAHLVLTGKGAPAHTDPLPSEFPPGVQVHADLAAFAAARIAAAEAAAAAAANAAPTPAA